MEEDFCGENPLVWQRMVERWFGMNEREQQYVQVKNQPKICQWKYGSESEMNGQRRLSPDEEKIDEDMGVLDEKARTMDVR